MQNEREDRNRGYGDYSRNEALENKTYMGYSAIPGPSFDTGRYVRDRDRNFSRDAYRSDNRDRTFGNAREGSRSYGSDAPHDRDRNYGNQDSSRDFADNLDRGRADFYEMGGYGHSQHGAYKRNTGNSGFGAAGNSGRNNPWSMNTDRERGYEQQYGRPNDEERGYAGPAYGSIPTGGRYDSDRDFSSGGITNMGGDYDREHTRGRQYQDNYDSSGTYIGDYDKRGGNQDRNQYDSGFTFGSGSAGTPPYGRFNTGDRYNQHEDDYATGNRRGGFGRMREGGRYDGSDSNRGGGWNQPRSSQGHYGSHSPQTGHPEYDRRNYREEDWRRQRGSHRDEDRGFFEQAGDRVRSWFGGDEDERNRY